MAGRRLAFRALRGWAADDHAAAFAAYRVSAGSLPAEWPRPDGTAPRDFFESRFIPVRIGSGPALVTGYYEPEVAGALEAPIKSATAGKFSFTAGVGENAHCPTAAALLPLLVSYARCD